MAETPDTKAQVKELKENTEYQIRVKAVNKAGESKPQQASIPFTTKHKEKKPKIDARHWNDVVKKIGQGFELDCKYTGYPEPTIEWVRIEEVLSHTQFNRLVSCIKEHPIRPLGACGNYNA